MDSEDQDIIVVQGRTPRVRGSRITVYDVMDYYTRGRDPAYIADVLSLTGAEVRAAIAYVEAHRAEVDAEYAEILARVATGNPPEVRAILAESHVKLMRLKERLAAERAAKVRPGVGDATRAG